MRATIPSVNRIKSITATLVSLVLIQLPLSTRVYAQYGGLQISPIKSIINVAPGSKEQLTVTLKNTDPKAGTVSVLFRNFTTNESENGEPKLVDDPNLPQGIQKWLSGTTSLRLGSNETRDYSLNISVPAGTAAGTYYGTALFNINTTGGESLGPSIGSLLFVNVGTITQQVKVEEFNLEGVSASTSGLTEGEVVVRLKNTGNGYTVPKIKLEIVDEANAILETLDANEGEGGILPGTIRKYSAKVSKQLEPPKTYRVRLTATTGSGESVAAEKILVQGSAPPQSLTKPQKKNNPVVYLIIGGATLLVLSVSVFLLKKRKKATVSLVPPPPSPSVFPNPTQDVEQSDNQQS